MEGLRPLGVGELIDAAIRIYRSRAKTLLLAVAVPVVPVLVLTTLVSFSSQPDLTVDPATGQTNFDGGDLALFFAGAIVTLIATTIATSIATAACFRSISGAYVGDDPDWRQSLRFAMSRFGSVLGLTLLIGLLTVLGLVACLVGVLVPMTFLSVAVPALLVEGLGVGDAMRRSWRLVRGTAWRVLGIVLLSALLGLVFQAALSAPIALIFLVDVSPLVEQIVNGVVTTISTVLVVPFSAALTMALYVDLRVRKEGFDLVLWSQRLGNAPTSNFPDQPGAKAPGSVAGGWAPGTATGGWAPSPPPPPPPPPPGSPSSTPGDGPPSDPPSGGGWGPAPGDAQS